MSHTSKSLVWLREGVKTPPFSASARIKAGFLLRCLQEGIVLDMPESRPMPSIGARCHELRVSDAEVEWRIIYRTDGDAIIVLAVFQKKTRQTPKHVIEICRQRLHEYDSA